MFLLAACTGTLEETDTGCEIVGADAKGVAYRGTGPMDEYFPYDGERHATYEGDDGETLLVDVLQPVEVVDEVEVATFTYTRASDAALLAQVKWASDSDGIRVVAGAEGTGDFVTYDPPIQLTSTSNYMNVGECVETTTGGTTWRGTFQGLEDIAVQWGLDWEGAVHLELEGGDAFFAGDYWLVTRYGPGWMELDGVKWVLSDYEWSSR